MAKSKANQLRIAVIGGSGRMGQEILSLAATDPSLEIVATVSRRADLPAPNVVRKMSGLPKGKIDVVIDFSLPEVLDEVCTWCKTNRTALVSGVTGLSAAQKKKISSLGQIIPVLWAPNMSVGVAVLAEMLAGFKSLQGFEFQIEETHHKHKKDKPSGTALFLQDKLEAAVGPTPEPLAIRGGGVFGIHKIWAMGEEETITLEHSALNRRVFARGALRAARWIRGRPAGVYTMADVIRS
ncbi:MAG: 4-hydroxy-tetrahydrodipicolinate reductase [Bdellovibrionaceae bacterium]|nr:4-hydroxy-tetrahydrodipicolinate reductase [Pseudobdellovibrionaceae bacterium]